MIVWLYGCIAGSNQLQLSQPTTQWSSSRSKHSAKELLVTLSALSMGAAEYVAESYIGCIHPKYDCEHLKVVPALPLHEFCVDKCISCLLACCFGKQGHASIWSVFHFKSHCKHKLLT